MISMLRMRIMIVIMIIIMVIIIMTIIKSTQNHVKFKQNHTECIRIIGKLEISNYTKFMLKIKNKTITFRKTPKNIFGIFWPYFKIFDIFDP